MTKQEIKNVLMNYHRTPKIISDELEIIRNCESEREKFSPRSAQVSGLPHGNSVSDRTFSDAMEGSKYFDEEIKFHRQNIIRLQEQQRWLRDAIRTLTVTERNVLEKTFMSMDGRKVPWKAVCTEVGYCKSQAQTIAKSALKNWKILKLVK